MDANYAHIGSIAGIVFGTVDVRVQCAESCISQFKKKTVVMSIIIEGNVSQTLSHFNMYLLKHIKRLELFKIL